MPAHSSATDPARAPHLAGPGVCRRWAAFLAFSACLIATARSADEVVSFRNEVEPVLVKYCHDCHGDGASKGKVALDRFANDAERTGNRAFWHNVLKNVRAEVMPPAGKDRPDAAERAKLEAWILRDVFRIDPRNPDPGRVTLRRLNRVEYQNTIRDLMGVEFKAFEEFPPDDTGYGFDNIGDVLTASPLLLEKYMDAAEVIVAKAVPTVSRVVAEQVVAGEKFASTDGKLNGRSVSFYVPAVLSHDFTASAAGEYEIVVEAQVDGAFDFDPGRARLTVRLGDDLLVQEEHKWQDGRKVGHVFRRRLPAGRHAMTFQLEPLVPEKEKKTHVNYRLRTVSLQGPLERERWVNPPNYDRFFSKPEAPTDPVARRTYAAEVLRRFVQRAHRRPVEATVVDRLVEIAEAGYSEPGKSFESGIARAMVAVLASPRFLFRSEQPGPMAVDGGHPFIDEHALASRLSYFLWSTMPDAALTELADRGDLRRELPAQVRRMLADAKSSALVENFTGQWLQTRDVEGMSINERSVLARDAGQDREQERVRDRFMVLKDLPDDQITPAQQKELDEIRASFRARGRKPPVELDGELRRAMKRETEMVFEHVLRENRSVLELIDADYTFLNERLAKHYGVTNVTGTRMRRVTLPAGSPRGGILTQGSVLVVTSNPTRTSPVKRGVFLLDQILGTPAPPPPADVPLLEESEKAFKDREPTLRETLELHRSQPLCQSCHDRMDPLGLALESFNALGMWRESERGQPITPGGRLITGERFGDIVELKKVLARDRKRDFYRCLATKLMTYALGRGLEDHDTTAVDELVARLDASGGRFGDLLLGVIESVPFQKRRSVAGQASVTPVPDSSR